MPPEEPSYDEYEQIVQISCVEDLSAFWVCAQFKSPSMGTLKLSSHVAFNACRPTLPIQMAMNLNLLSWRLSFVKNFLAKVDFLQNPEFIWVAQIGFVEIIWQEYLVIVRSFFPILTGLKISKLVRQVTFSFLASVYSCSSGLDFCQH